LFRRSGARINNTYGGGSGNIWLDNLGCTGNENALEDCPHNGWGATNCDHDEDVAIECNPPLTTAANGTHIIHLNIRLL